MSFELEINMKLVTQSKSYTASVVEQIGITTLIVLPDADYTIYSGQLLKWVPPYIFVFLFSP